MNVSDVFLKYFASYYTTVTGARTAGGNTGLPTLGSDTFGSGSDKTVSAEMLKEFFSQYGVSAKDLDSISIDKLATQIGNLTEDDLVNLASGIIPDKLKTTLQASSNDTAAPTVETNSTQEETATDTVGTDTSVDETTDAGNPFKTNTTDGAQKTYTPGKVSELSSYNPIKEIQNDVNKALKSPNAAEFIQILNKISAKTIEICNVQATVREAVEQKDEKLTEIDEKTSELDEKTTELNQTATEMATTVGDIKTQAEQIYNVVNKINNNEDATKTAEAAHENTKSEISKCEENISSLDSQISTAQSTVDSLNSQLSNSDLTDADRASLESQLSSAQSNLNNLQSQKAAEEARLASLQTTEQEQASAIEKLNGDKNDLKSLLNDYKAKQSELKAQLQEKADKVNELKNQITEYETQINDLETELNSIDEDIKGYESDIATLKAQNQDLIKEFNKLLEAKGLIPPGSCEGEGEDPLEAAFKKTKADLDNTEKELAITQEKIDDLREKHTQTVNELNSAKTDVETAKATLTQTENQINDALKLLDDIDSVLAGLL